MNILRLGLLTLIGVWLASRTFLRLMTDELNFPIRCVPNVTTKLVGCLRPVDYTYLPRYGYFFCEIGFCDCRRCESRCGQTRLLRESGCVGAQMCIPCAINCVALVPPTSRMKKKTNVFVYVPHGRLARNCGCPSLHVASNFQSSKPKKLVESVRLGSKHIISMHLRWTSRGFADVLFAWKNENYTYEKTTKTYVGSEHATHIIAKRTTWIVRAHCLGDYILDCSSPHDLVVHPLES